MADSELKGIPSWGRVLIETQDGPKEIRGVVRRFEGVSPEQVMADVKKAAKPYFDYFIFSSPPTDPANPQTALAFSVSVGADKFSANGKPFKARLLMSDFLGTLADVPGARPFGNPIDNAWHNIKKIDVQFDLPKNAKLTRAEERTRKSFAERLEAKIGGSDSGLSDIRRAVEETADEMQELTRHPLSDDKVEPEDEPPFGVRSLNVEIIDDPDGEKGAKAIKVSVRIIPAPTGLLFDGLPDPVREKAIEFLDGEMQKTFEEHPLIYSRRFSDVDPLLTGTAGPPEKPMRLVLKKDGDAVSWHFPPNVPVLNDPFTDGIRALVTQKAMNRVPAPEPDAQMQIPAKVMDALADKLKEWLNELPGLFDANIVRGDDGVTRLKVMRMPHPKIVITDTVVQGLKKFGIDLSDETRIADRESVNFSLNKHNEFVSKIAAKYEKAGYELLSDVKYKDTGTADGIDDELSIIWKRLPDGNLEFDPRPCKKLIRPGRIEITGDVDLPELGGMDALKKALGSTPMTRAEFKKRLLDIEEIYHKAGYLILKENPLSKNGIQLAAMLKEDGESGTINIKIARAGKISISGARVKEFNKRKIIEALKIKEGDPLKADFMNRVFIAAERTNLAIDPETIASFIMRPDSRTDVIIHADEKQNSFNAGIGTDGENVTGQSSVILHHKVSGISEFGATASLGTYIGNADVPGGWWNSITGSMDVFMQSVPLNEDGVYLSSGLGVGRQPYLYRDWNGRAVETGVAENVRGSFTVHIPLGSDGIASKLYLNTGVHGAVVSREGERAISEGGGEVDKVTYYHGESIGPEYMDSGLLAERDMLRVGATVGMDHNVTDASGDATIRGSIVYALPLGDSFTFEEKASAGKRVPVYGEGLPPERAFMAGSIPLIDFGRSLGDPYASTFFWYDGAFVMLTQNSYIQPGLGATVSSGSNGAVAAGGGVVLRVPIIGMSVYLGVDANGRPTGGLGIGKVWEL